MLFHARYLCFKHALHTNICKLLFKRCENFINMLLLYNEFWCKINWCVIKNFSRFYIHTVYVLRGTSYFSICFEYWWCLTLKSIIYSCYYQFFTIFINLGLEFGIKAIIRWWMLRGASKHYSFNVFWWELVWFHFFPTWTLSMLLLVFQFFIIWRKIGLDFCLKYTSENLCSDVKVITQFSLCSDDNVFDSSFGSLVSSNMLSASCSEFKWSLFSYWYCLNCCSSYTRCLNHLSYLSCEKVKRWIRFACCFSIFYILSGNVFIKTSK